jgi:hypothetical protein
MRAPIPWVGGGSFRIALRSEPVYAAASHQPIIDLSFALESLYVFNVGTRAMSLDLPVALFNALHFEDDSGRFRFGHGGEYTHDRPGVPLGIVPRLTSLVFAPLHGDQTLI